MKFIQSRLSCFPQNLEMLIHLILLVNVKFGRYLRIVLSLPPRDLRPKLLVSSNKLHAVVNDKLPAVILAQGC